MKRRTRLYAHVILFIVGIVLMVGGIVTTKYGASIGGLILAAVNYWQWDAWRKQASVDDSSKYIMRRRGIRLAGEGGAQ